MKTSGTHTVVPFSEIDKVLYSDQQVLIVRKSQVIERLSFTSASLVLRLVSSIRDNFAQLRLQRLEELELEDFDFRASLPFMNWPGEETMPKGICFSERVGILDEKTGFVLGNRLIQMDEHRLYEVC